MSDVSISRRQIELGVKKLGQIHQKNLNNPDFINMFSAKDEVINRYQRLFHPDILSSLSKEDFLSFLKSENNMHWSHLYRQQNQITSDMDALREAIRFLVDENIPLEKRLDRLRPPNGEPWIKGLSRAIITPILLIMYPEKYGVWNGTSEAGMRALNLWPQVKTTASFSEKYIAINNVLLELCELTGYDLWTLDGLWWGVEGIGAGKIAPPSPDENEIDQKLTPSNSFGMERYLQEFLFQNWELLPQFEDWIIYQVDGEDVGMEFNTDIGRIDILAKHETRPEWLVIELKRNQASDDTMGQVQRYMGWVEVKLASPGDLVRGLIIAKEMTEKLRFALKPTSNISFMNYEVNFSLHPNNLDT
jgi:hypothetical protein